MALISRGIQRSFAAVLLSTSLFAQQIQPERTTAEDHQNMMAQLGIKSLRPAPSGNESAPNQANYDEATANPFPNLPQVLTLENGQEVTTADMWWKQRRPEIVELFEREVLGRVPRNVPKVTWSVGDAAVGMIGKHKVIGRQLTGHVDNTSYPSISVDIQMSLVMPGVSAPIPVMMMIGSGTLPQSLGGPAPARGRGAPPPASRKRSASNRATARRRLGCRLHQPDEHSGRQRRGSHERHHRAREQRSVQEAR
jgi:hypothetical protein